jgi:hypothetical protein
VIALDHVVAPRRSITGDIKFERMVMVEISAGYAGSRGTIADMPELIQPTIAERGEACRRLA